MIMSSINLFRHRLDRPVLRNAILFAKLRTSFWILNVKRTDFSAVFFLQLPFHARFVFNFFSGLWNFNNNDY